MLAQSTIAAPKAGAHDPGSAGAKKARGLAGLFSEILTQAQKSLGAKGAEGAKGAMGAKVTHAKPESTIALSADHRRPSSRANARGAAGLTIPKLHSTSEKAIAAKKSGLELVKTTFDSGPPSADASVVRRAQDRRLNLHADEHSEAEVGMAKGLEDKRRAKAKPENTPDGAAAAAASGVGAKAISANANFFRVKASQTDIDTDSSIDRKIARHSSEPKVTVLDLRRSSESRREAASKADANAGGLPKNAIREVKAPGSDAGRELYRELSLDARSPGDAGGASSMGKADAAQGRSQDFQAMLAERLRDAWNGEIVQSAHIVLKDGDAGTIRLRLRPESLGNVKIELNLSENNISGRIVVESDEAKSAFERNMNALTDAFKQGGFDSAKLEVSVGGGSGGDARSGAFADSSGGPFFSERLRSAVGSPGDPATATSAYARRGGAVDILA